VLVASKSAWWPRGRDQVSQRGCGPSKGECPVACVAGLFSDRISVHVFCGATSGRCTWCLSRATKFNMALALVASLVGVALGSSVSTAGWKPVGTTSGEEMATMLPFTVALKPSNLAQLDALLEAVSVRSHAHNGNPSACHFVCPPPLVTAHERQPFTKCALLWLHNTFTCMLERLLTCLPVAC
jgi:hypothetical protein